MAAVELPGVRAYIEKHPYRLQIIRAHIENSLLSFQKDIKTDIKMISPICLSNQCFRVLS